MKEDKGAPLTSVRIVTSSKRTTNGMLPFLVILWDEQIAKLWSWVDTYPTTVGNTRLIHTSVSHLVTLKRKTVTV